ncbi:MAG TPA: hydroxylamine reductase, partial [Anaeromyxobacteraceae bacterium]|nr:hydroxylamine reductase [Anaeromyxobacteraceae bacterium]
KVDHQLDKAMLEALFTTVTNVNFDPARLEVLLHDMATQCDRARKLCEKAGAPTNVPAPWTPAKDSVGFVKQGESVGIATLTSKLGPDVTGLHQMLAYGLKGAAAYAEHARILGHEDDRVYAFFHEALAYLGRENPSADELVSLCMRCGEVNLKVMEILDKANTGTYGHPVPTPVRIEPKKGKAILVSGHDLKDLELLLEQTAGKGVNVYTHGEMLPAHGYPGLKKHPHLVGNYGGAWQDQAKEFDEFPGAILMTTNCIQRPRESYRARIFTSGLVAWPGVRHIADGNFAPVIQAALAAPGFARDGGDKTILVGFGHEAVLSVAGKVVEAVKSGAVKHFFLIGGCDGARSGRNYYTELAESVPNDCVILTLACGKYRFNKKDFGTIGGIPRLLDIGQCNDAYSAIQIASALAKAFGTDVNGLPLSLVLSWYEQKAVAILLTLLSLGIKNIRLGPTLPAFVTPSTLNVLVQKFGLKPTTTATDDLKAIFA